MRQSTMIPYAEYRSLVERIKQSMRGGLRADGNMLNDDVVLEEEAMSHLNIMYKRYAASSSKLVTHHM